MVSGPQNVNVLQDGGYSELVSLKLASPLSSFPLALLDHAPTLCHLDLSGTGLSSLPAPISRLTALKRAFFSDCAFEHFPEQLASCPELEMVAFRNNKMTLVPEGSLPKKLRWLILTNNMIESLPASIGQCERLQKCMLAGNRLSTLPDEMAACKKLGLLRLAANRLQDIPDWLMALPELAFLSISANDCCRRSPSQASQASLEGQASASRVEWDHVKIHHVLGQGASGTTFKAVWQDQEVALKLFKGDVSSDGTPADEMLACIAAGRHPNLIDTLGCVTSPDLQQGLLMQLIPSSYTALGQPPSMQSCTRDCFGPDAHNFTPEQALRLLRGIAAAAEHIHARGISHGDLYAHNVLVNPSGNAILGDFGAANVFDSDSPVARHAQSLARLEILAFGHLIEDVFGLVPSWQDVSVPDPDADYPHCHLLRLHRRCTHPDVQQRPSFSDVAKCLSGLKVPD